MNKTLTKIILAIVIFCVSAGAYYYPVHKKGYPTDADYLSLIEARNFALGGTFMSQDKIGIYLSSANAHNGVVTSIQNPLTPIIYGYIFKFFGFHPNLPFHLSIIAFSIFNVLVFLLLSRIFSVGVGFIGGILGSFIPAMGIGAFMGGFYEWAMLFFIGALWLFLGSKKGPLEASLTRILFTSIFFALAALARNGFVISFIPFFLYDSYVHRSIKRGLIFLLPFLIIFGSTLTSISWLGVPNGFTYGYINTKQQPSSEISHLFSDPYTYFFNKDRYIAEHFPVGSSLGRVVARFMGRYGYDVSIKDTFRAYAASATAYVKQSFNIINFGGPVMIFLALVGSWYLRKRNPKLLGLLIFWPIAWFLFWVYDQVGSSDHFLEIIFVIITLSSLGVYYIYELIKNNLNTRNRYIVAFGMFILLLIQLGQSAKWRLYESYRSSFVGATMQLASAADKKIDGVYAVGIHPGAGHALNYLTDHDTVIFDSDTVRGLLKEKKLKEAFGIYKTKAAFGYSSDLSSQIKSTLKIPVFPYNKK